MQDPLLDAFVDFLVNTGPYIIATVWLLWTFLPSLVASIAFGKLWRIQPFGCLVFIVYAPLAAIMKQVTMILSPLLAIVSVVFNWTNLPMPLYLLQTHDQSLDAENQKGWPQNTKGLYKVSCRMSWLLRNPAYGFMHYVLGFDSRSKGPVITHQNPKSVLDGSMMQLQTQGRAVSCRGVIGPIYVWFGWKLVRKDLDGKRMLALGMSIASTIK